MYKSKLKDIKKALLSDLGYIRLGIHTKERMYKRGYTKGDMVRCIMTGTIKEVQYGFSHSISQKAFKYVIEGKDDSNNPIVVVVSEEGKYQFHIVTVMPPIDGKRFNNCI